MTGVSCNSHQPGVFPEIIEGHQVFSMFFVAGIGAVPFFCLLIAVKVARSSKVFYADVFDTSVVTLFYDFTATPLSISL